MRYESTTGLAGADIDELAERVQQILDGRGISLGRHLLDLRRHLVAYIEDAKVSAQTANSARQLLRNLVSEAHK